MSNQQYTFQTVSVPGSQADTIGGINDFGELSGSNTIWAGIGPENGGDPYPAAFTNTGGTFNFYGAGGVPYGQHSVGNAINNRGQVVGSSGHYSQTARGYIYSAGSFTEIDGPQNGYNTTANGINDRGQVVGAMSPNGLVAGIPPGPTQAYVWQNGSISQMFSYHGATSTTATGINDWGQIVGYYSDGTTSAADQGFLYANGTMRTIDVPGAALTDVTAINNVGEIVGSYFDGTHWHGFIDQGGRMSFVNAPGAADTWINSVNDLGQIAGAFDTSSSSAATGFVATLGNTHSLIADLNAMLPKQVSQVIGNSFGHAYFDPTVQPVVMPAAHG